MKKTETGHLSSLQNILESAVDDHCPRRDRLAELGSLTAEFDRKSRANSYSAAHTRYPTARKAELDATLRLIGPCRDKTIVEVGAGQGFLTNHLVAGVGPNGQVYAIDNSQSQLEALKKRCPTAECVTASTEHIPLKSNIADIVVSLANFHHVSSKSNAFSECVRILKPGGTFVLVDVCHGTPVQKYFDNVVDKICSTGHKHTFLDKKTCESICASLKVEIYSWQMIEVPWIFDSEDAAANFLNWVHDATCNPADSLEHAAKYLEIHSHENGKKICVGWQLFFMCVRKPFSAVD